MAQRILVVEDDPEFLQLVQFTLEQAGHLVQPASSGQTALRWLREPSAKPDLVILDIGLPDKGLDGLALCRALKKDAATGKIPVLILTGYSDNEHRLAATLAQADLILHKPISPKTLQEAVHSLLSRPQDARRGVLRRAGLELDPQARTVFFNGKHVDDLGQRLFDVLYVLVEHAPNPVSARFILGALRLKDRDAQIAVIVSRLRARLRGAFGVELVSTVPGQGYRLDLPDGRAQAVG